MGRVADSSGLSALPATPVWPLKFPGSSSRGWRIRWRVAPLLPTTHRPGRRPHAQCPQPPGPTAPARPPARGQPSRPAPHTWPSAASAAQHRPGIRHLVTHLVTHGLRGPRGCHLPCRLQEAPRELHPWLAPTPWHHVTCPEGRSAQPSPAPAACGSRGSGRDVREGLPPQPGARTPVFLAPQPRCRRRCSPRGLTPGGSPQAWGGASARHLRTPWHRPPCPRLMQTGSRAGRNCATQRAFRGVKPGWRSACPGCQQSPEGPNVCC